MVNTAVIVFPGSNCDRDLITTFEKISGKKPHMVWHADTTLPEGIDIIGVPGGFSYGDYLRSGAIAARSPIMQEVIKAAKRGVHIIGICNGFQVLTESGLLPGVLMRNKYLKFICKKTHLKPVNTDTAFTKNYANDKVISLPIAHHDGNYFADDETIKKLWDNGQVAFQYCSAEGAVEESFNPNGSKSNIAGIFSDNKRVLGMMPHPERACDALTTGVDGIPLFKSLLAVR
jgi:phosphoribosylformylglycinamidine synthase I